MNNDVSIGSFTQMIEKLSIGDVKTREVSLYPSEDNATAAGSWTILHNCSLSVRLAKKAIPNPTSARMSRLRNSSRCSRNDMRSMPSSSGSSISSAGGGGGGGGGGLLLFTTASSAGTAVVVVPASGLG